MSNKWMLENSGNQKDGLWTFACISFAVTTLAVVLSFIDKISIGSFVLEIPEANVPLISLYFGGAFTSYVVRRNAKEKNKPIDQKKPESPQRLLD